MADVDEDGVVTAARAVARGTVEMVLALPGAAQRGEMVLHNHPSGRLEPSEPDLGRGGPAARRRHRVRHHQQHGDRLYVVVEVPRAPPVHALDPLAVVEHAGRGRPVAGVLGHYEDRPSQRDMAAHIADAYNDGGVVLLEAGTGVGKSFAYLVPGARLGPGERRAHRRQHQHHQSAGTAGRQGPPAAARALAETAATPTFALLKGWRNYLCLSRLHQATGAQRSLLEPDKQDELVCWPSGPATPPTAR